MRNPPFPVVLELGGWTLLWARLELAAPPAGAAVAGTAGDLVAGASGDPAPAAASVPAPAADALVALRRRVEARARSRRDLARLPDDPTVAAVRGLFRAAGCDPTRYRPSSEALLRRVLKGEELPAIQPLVDLNNCLSIELAVPCSMLLEGSFTPPVTLRAGRTGEAFDSLRGPLNLEGKPLLADAAGPFSTPIADSQRVKMRSDSRRAWLAAYLPAAVLAPEAALACLESLLRDLTHARLELAAASPGSPAS
jgi:DNA/RNA-binding domain of Phe-tRNA-synthetase-like protein